MNNDIASTRLSAKLQAISGALDRLMREEAGAPVEFVLIARVGCDIHYTTSMSIVGALQTVIGAGDQLAARARSVAARGSGRRPGERGPAPGASGKSA